MPLFIRPGSIVPMGPFLQYSSEKAADPIELRLYRGADGKFTLYEDQGDNYNYEKREYATIQVSWNEARRTLEFGKRTGEFPGMLKERTFNVVWVSENHGAGIPVTEKPDTVVHYKGDIVRVLRP
jgi:alpha-D-xyloside xylohydrolase